MAVLMLVGIEAKFGILLLGSHMIKDCCQSPRSMMPCNPIMADLTLKENTILPINTE